MKEVPIIELMEGILYDNLKANINEDELINMKDLSELKIHKVLYFLYGIYHSRFGKENNRELFDANFQAWRYGPVEVNYRYDSKKFLINLEDNEQEIKSILGNLMKFDVWDLVDQSHLTKPWIDAFNTGKMFAEISNDEIHKYFEEINERSGK